jgi:probable addiction module antidote protein
MSQVTARYEDGLKAALMNPDEAAAYLNAALEENDQEVFLLALRDIAEARGFPQVAQEPFLESLSHWENLYPVLLPTRNPQLASLNALLHSMGLRLTVEVEAV